MREREGERERDHVLLLLLLLLWRHNHAGPGRLVLELPEQVVPEAVPPEQVVPEISKKEERPSAMCVRGKIRRTKAFLHTLTMVTSSLLRLAALKERATESVSEKRSEKRKAAEKRSSWKF